jgi:hypothetical protein
MTQFGDLVTLVNRTKGTTLTAVWDGQQFHFEPGEHANVPLVIAEAAYRQNPLHGSEDPIGDPQYFDSLIGIKGARLPFGTVTPIEQSAAGERINRKLVPAWGARRSRSTRGGATYFDAKMGTEKVDLSDDAPAQK